MSIADIPAAPDDDLERAALLSPSKSWLRRVVVPVAATGVVATGTLEGLGFVGGVTYFGLAYVAFFSSFCLAFGAVSAQMMWWHKSVSPLDPLFQSLGKRSSALAEMSGVSKRTLRRWGRHGVPQDQAVRMRTIMDIVEILDTHAAKPDRNTLLTRPSTAFGDTSLVQMVAAGKEREVLFALRQATESSKQTLRNVGLSL